MAENLTPEDAFDPAAAWESFGPSAKAWLLAVWDEEEARDEASSKAMHNALGELTLRDQERFNLMRNAPNGFWRTRQVAEYGAALSGRVRQTAMTTTQLKKWALSFADEALHADNTALRFQLSKAKQAREEMEKDRDAALTRASQAEKDRDTAGAAATALQALLAESEKNHVDAGQMNKELDRELVAAHASRDAARKWAERAEANSKEHLAARDAAQAELSRARNDIEAMDVLRLTLAKRASELASDVVQLRQERDAAVARLDRQEVERRMAQEDAARHRGLLDTEKQENARLTKEARRLQDEVTRLLGTEAHLRKYMEDGYTAALKEMASKDEHLAARDIMAANVAKLTEENRALRAAAEKERDARFAAIPVVKHLDNDGRLVWFFFAGAGSQQGRVEDEACAVATQTGLRVLYVFNDTLWFAAPGQTRATQAGTYDTSAKPAAQEKPVEPQRCGFEWAGARDRDDGFCGPTAANGGFRNKDNHRCAWMCTTPHESDHQCACGARRAVS